MNEPETSVRLWGQILFADVAGARVTVDLVLSRREDPHGAPATVVVELAGESEPQRRAQQLLVGWADEGAMVSVDVVDGPHGAQVAITADSARLVMRPEAHGDDGWDRSVWKVR